MALASSVLPYSLELEACDDSRRRSTQKSGMAGQEHMPVSAGAVRPPRWRAGDMTLAPPCHRGSFRVDRTRRRPTTLPGLGYAGSTFPAVPSTVTRIPVRRLAVAMPLDGTANGPLPRSATPTRSLELRSSADIPPAATVRTSPSGTRAPAAMSSPSWAPCRRPGRYRPGERLEGAGRECAHRSFVSLAAATAARTIQSTSSGTSSGDSSR